MLTCGIPAIIMTLVRLWIRRGRFWWDDGWALFSLLALLTQIPTVFLRAVPLDSHAISKTTRIASYYLMATTFYCVIWSARQSILFSIIRLQPDVTIRRRLYGASIVMLLCVLLLLAQLYWTCEPLNNATHWKDLRNPQCHLPKDVAIFQLVTDILSDVLLVLAPLHMIKNLANRGLKRRLMVIFSTSIVTTIVSLVHAGFIIDVGGKPVLLSALVEDSVSLMVANMPVLATAAMRFAGVRVVDEDSVPTAKLTTMRFDPFKASNIGGGGGGGVMSGVSIDGGRRRTGFFRSVFSPRSTMMSGQQQLPAAAAAASDGSATLAGGTTTFKLDDDVERDVRSETGDGRTFRLDELRSTIGQQHSHGSVDDKGVYDASGHEHEHDEHGDARKKHVDDVEAFRRGV
ncbi:hypothetical protein BKA62DRAFT_744242 [Auriculariales sp. MPI-PUGE-AT-0066]|nr:hypothetical protein BKA62DRAFT_744242 [Auriculariales sp. MPI-PUGE-AT-0066]